MKGNLGSPYSTRDPYSIEETMAEPCLELSPEDTFCAFVEAAHMAGMRVIGEFVFRTASPDSDWAKEHPEWFYWIDARIEDREPGSMDPHKYGQPIFDEGVLGEIKDKVENRKEFRGLPEPPPVFRDMFAEPPSRETLFLENGRWHGISRDGRKVRIATAFADWPPDDNQPPWTDAVYLRLYDHEGFNYVAYNTVRMYDEALARPENAVKPLWEKIEGILPSWIRRFGIDGAMIDMGHALPGELKRGIVRRARNSRPGFAFLDEKFSIEVGSGEEGYDAVLGYSWLVTSRWEGLKGLLRRCSEERLPVPFLATPETHDSPRAASREGGVVHSRFAFAMLSFLPAISWIHSGFELGETTPVNTGLDFKKEEIERYPPEKLPLFSACSYRWISNDAFIEYVREINAMRRKNLDKVVDPDPSTFELMALEEKMVLTYRRKDLVITGNMDFKGEKKGPLAPGQVVVTGGGNE